jgi:G:T-mismatch repair DNA endonuclease (very short patch repair protein)
MAYNPHTELRATIMPTKLTQSAFIDRSRDAHGDRYDYSVAEYINNMKPVNIACRTHGVFSQRPAHHMDGRGCPKCKAELTSARFKDDTASFVAKAREIHGDAYDYSRVEYIKSSLKVEITCPIHGAFFQPPNNHISRKTGCPKCAGKNMSTNEFIEKARSVHGDTFGYQHTEYRGIKTAVTVTCTKHGDILQTAENHLLGNGCHLCWRESNSSKSESDLADWCESLGLNVQRNNKDALGRMEIDIYLPDQKLGIEYNGCYWHSDRLQKNTRHHEFKHIAASRVGIRILTVWDYDWTHKRDIVERMIAHAAGKDIGTKVGARSCSLMEVSGQAASAFYNKHHIQGACRGGVVNVALNHPMHGLVGMMTFTQGGTRRGMAQDGEWELARYATSQTVQGGASRLFTDFVRRYKPIKVWSFSDNQHFGGRLYETLGFKQDGTIRPDYRLVLAPKLVTWHKSLWQRKSIQKRLHELGLEEPFDHTTDPRTERQMQDFANVLRVWDSGKTRWLWSEE